MQDGGAVGMVGVIAATVTGGKMKIKDLYEGLSTKQAQKLAKEAGLEMVWDSSQKSWYVWNPTTTETLNYFVTNQLSNLTPEKFKAIFLN